MRVRLLDHDDRRGIPAHEGDVFEAIEAVDTYGYAQYRLQGSCGMWCYTDLGGQVEILGDDPDQVPGPEAAR